MLEKEFLAYYNSNPKLNAQVSLELFYKYIEFYETEALKFKFLNPFRFSEKYKVDIDETLRLFTLTTEDSFSPNLLILRPYFQCLTNNCYKAIFLDDENLLINTSDNNKFFYCPECDNDYDFNIIKDEITFVYQVQNKYYELLLMKDKSSTLEKIEVIAPEALKKFFPPSTAELADKISITERKGAIYLDQLEESNIDSNGEPQSTKASSLIGKFANKRAHRQR